VLKFNKSADGFTLSFKDHAFLSYEAQNPCFKIGKGKATYRMKHGDFKIKEKEHIEIPLPKYTLLNQGEGVIELEFSDSKEEIKLKTSFLVEDDNLIIRLNCSHLEFNRFWLRIQATSNEAIFGLGEQFSEVNFRGREVPLFVEEQGVGRGDPPITGAWYSTYHPQPTFVSSENYFCHCNSASYARFNFTNENYHELYIWSIPDKIIFGKYDSTLDTVSHLSKMLGIQPILPDWVYDGVWLGIQGGQEIVEQKIKTCRDNGVKVSAVWCQDWQGIHMQGRAKRLIWNWKYDEALYPNLPDFIKQLNNKGIKFLGYNNSMLAKGEEQFKEAIKKNLCIMDDTGEYYKIVTDSGDKAMLDLTNSKTLDWFKEIIKENMLKIGLSGWMADYGEYLPMDCTLDSGESPETFHNRFPVIFAKVNLEAIQEMGKEGEIVFFTRAGYSGVSEYTTSVWAGDQLVDWSLGDGLGTVIAAGISIGICGIGYYHFDIGGFHSAGKYIRTKEMFMRWTEASVCTMTMRTHESIRPFDNLQFDYDNEVLTHFAKMVDIHVKLKPYMQKLSQEYQEKGIPPFRGCFLHYENDPELFNLKYQYLFGSDLLVAPVIEPNSSEREVYFPEDIWIHIWSGKEFKKGYKIVAAPIGQPPIFYRKESKFTDLFCKLKDV
jgi:alpha-glucosidase